MKFRVLDRDELDIPAWDDLAGGGSFFHTTSWADICVDGIGNRARSIFLILYDDDRLIAGMPAVITRRFGMSTLSSMPFGTYGAPIFAPGAAKDNHRQFMIYLDRFMQTEKFSGVTIADFEGSLSEWDGSGIRRGHCLTHVISLDDTDEYRPHKKIEYDIRAGQKVESKIIRIDSPSRVAEFYRLYRMTEKRHGTRGPRRGLSFFEAVYNHLAGSGKLYWTGLTVEGSLVGSQIHFIHGETLFNWQTVSDYEMRRYKPSQLLMDDAIRYAAEQGLTKVNLGASPPEAAGLIRYKERWQGEKIEYDLLTVRSWYRRLLGR
jgi:hypothetical protein